MKNLDELTPRERDVLALLNRGLKNREIAQALVITESVVEIHLHRIYRKLGVTSRTQAVIRAFQQGSDAQDRGNP